VIVNLTLIDSGDPSRTGVPPEVRLRKLLKVALRMYGYRCAGMSEADQDAGLPITNVVRVVVKSGKLPADDDNSPPRHQAA
jgi:hypothetical protein